MPIDILLIIGFIIYCAGIITGAAIVEARMIEHNQNFLPPEIIEKLKPPNK